MQVLQQTLLFMTEHRANGRISTISGHVLSDISFGKIYFGTSNFGTRDMYARFSADRQSMLDKFN